MKQIAHYDSKYQNDIDAMMREVAGEYALAFTRPGFEFVKPQNYWVVLSDKIAVGTIGVNVVGSYAILKKLFLKKEFRGEEKGFSFLLLETAIAWCREKGIKQLYLGTMDQFKAAQSFYSKMGFIKITEDSLPENYDQNPIDTLFYKLDL